MKTMCALENEQWASDIARWAKYQYYLTTFQSEQYKNYLRRWSEEIEKRYPNVNWNKVKESIHD